MSGTTSRPGTNDDHYDPLDLLTLDQVAAIVKRHRKTLERDVRAKRLKVVHLGRSTRVPRAELERYIADASGYDDPPTPIR